MGRRTLEEEALAKLPGTTGGQTAPGEWSVGQGPSKYANCKRSATGVRSSESLATLLSGLAHLYASLWVLVDGGGRVATLEAGAAQHVDGALPLVDVLFAVVMAAHVARRVVLRTSAGPQLI